MTAGDGVDIGANPARGSDPEQPVRRLMVFSTVALALLMMSVDSTIVATALPTLQDDLGASINWAGWTITGYSFGFLLMLPISGKLCERYGRRSVFLASVVVFVVASLCCGLAGNVYVLIALRVLQAAGGAGFTPSATGIVVDHFGAVRDRAVSFFGSIFPVGAMAGPIFGGLFVSYWSWRGIFFVNVPIGLVVLAMALRFVPHDRFSRADGPRTRNRGMDLPGMALLGSGLIAAMFAASFVGEHEAGLEQPVFAALAAAAVFALALFVRHIGRTPAPFIAPRLIWGRGFGTVNLVNTFYGGFASGAVALIPLYATHRYGLGALDSGTLLTAQAAAAVVCSSIATLALRRTGYRLPLYAGCIAMAIGMFALATRPLGGISSYLWLAVAAAIIGAGSGTINPASRNAGLQLAPEQSATLAAFRTMGRQVGSILAVSLATAILTGSPHPGMQQAWFYAVAAALFVIALPVIARVPEHRGAW